MGGPMPYRQNAECEREFDDRTGMTAVIDLQRAMSPQQCQQQVQMSAQRQQCGYTWVFGPGGECSCVRPNARCDEDQRPGFTIYQLNMAGMGGMHAGGMAMGMSGGMRPSGMGMGMSGGMRPSGMGMTGMGMGMTGGMGMGGYVHLLSASAPCTGLDETTCGSAENCKWTESGCEIYTEKTEAEDTLANARWALLYVVLPIFISALFLSLLVVVYRSCQYGKAIEDTHDHIIMDPRMHEPILLDSRADPSLV